MFIKDITAFTIKQFSSYLLNKSKVSLTTGESYPLSICIIETLSKHCYATHVHMIFTHIELELEQKLAQCVMRSSANIGMTILQLNEKTLITYGGMFSNQNKILNHLSIDYVARIYSCYRMDGKFTKLIRNFLFPVWETLIKS